MMIKAASLAKRFGNNIAVDGIDFGVAQGEVFGFLGPNGAGKSSTMRMIACMSPPSEGSLSVLGMDAARDGVSIRSRIGVVPQDDNLDTELTVRDNLVIYGRYFGLPRAELHRRADELLDFARLTDRENDLVDTLSGGMRRRLVIARALINQPELLLLDEPTTGLDPQARHLLWERLYTLKRQGVTLVLTTHYMDEAEQLCDRLVIMDEGRIAAEGSPQQLIQRYSTKEVVELRYPTPDEQNEATEQIRKSADDSVDRVEPLPDRLLLYTTNGDAVVSRLDGHIQTSSVLVRRSTLEDVFLHLTGRTLVE